MAKREEWEAAKSRLARVKEGWRVYFPYGGTAYADSTSALTRRYNRDMERGFNAIPTCIIKEVTQ